MMEGLRPPSRIKAWEWAEENIILDHTSPTEGKISTSLTPMVRHVLNDCQNNKNERVTVLCSAQSAKTQTIMNFVAWIMANDPDPTFWVMAAHDEAKEFAKTRLIPLLSRCPALDGIMPQDRFKVTSQLIMLEGMNLMLRGSNSKSKLQSVPVRWLILDEVRNYARGALELVLKRTRAFWNSRTIMISTAGGLNDAIHRAYIEGSQTQYWFKCTECGHGQPFRFGRKATPIFQTERKRGGLRWDTNDITKPDGIWNFDELLKTVRYECEECEHRFIEADKGKLIGSLFPVDTNPHAAPGNRSHHWNALYIPWIKWEDLAVEYIMADWAMRKGDIEPLRAFVQETEGCPWELRGETAEPQDIKKRCGALNDHPYKRGEKWNELESIKIMTIDRQAAKGGFYKYVIRQWMQNGNSRLIQYGACADENDVRFIQQKHDIQDNYVFLDSGWLAQDCYKIATQFGWTVMKGVGRDYFYAYDNKPKSSRRRKDVPAQVPWKMSSVDPSLGLPEQGRFNIPLLLWSNPSYKNRLMLFIILGKGPLWLLPDDVGDDYIEEILSEERTVTENAKGQEQVFWRKIRTNDYLDCELMQLVVLDASGVSVGGSIDLEGNVKTDEPQPIQP